MNERNDGDMIALAGLANIGGPYRICASAKGKPAVEALTSAASEVLSLIQALRRKSRRKAYGVARDWEAQYQPIGDVWRRFGFDGFHAERGLSLRELGAGLIVAGQRVTGLDRWSRSLISIIDLNHRGGQLGCDYLAIALSTDIRERVSAGATPGIADPSDDAMALDNGAEEWRWTMARYCRKFSILL